MSDLWSRRLRALPWLPPARYPELVQGDEVALDVRRHPITLALPVARTMLASLVILLDSAPAGLLVLFAVTVGWWARARLHAGWRRASVAAAVTTLLLVGMPGSGQVLLAVGLLLWLAEDLADWYTDRLVVSRSRIYRLYGVFTTHSPSMALTAVTYIDALQPLLGRVFGYGTILLDSVAQRDEPLSRFDHLPQADFVHVKILELRSSAVQRYPQAPGTSARG